MVKEILKGVYSIKIPLPETPLRELNSYLVKGERNLLIDTGFNVQSCYESLTAGLEACGADMDKTDILITHFHADHGGLCARIASSSSRIYMGAIDIEYFKWLCTPEYQEQLRDTARSYGVPEKTIHENFEGNPAVKYRAPISAEYTPVQDGHVFEIGDYCFEVITTPGHTPGHICLHDKDHKLFVSGDHILFDITPNISTWIGIEDSLGSYLDSLRRVSALDIETTMSAHRDSGGNCRKRIEELLDHHENRLAETLDIVKEHPDATVYTIASHMRWSIRARSWEDFPAPQKWFATMETAAHLEYLAARGALKRAVDDGRIIFN